MATLPSSLTNLLGKSNKPSFAKSINNTCSLSLAFMCVLLSFSAQAKSIENDSDGDGLTDSYEIKIGTEPYLSDTDGDSIKDADEVSKNLTQPLDSDKDGVIDALDYDDDNDGLPTILESKKDSDKDGSLDYLDTDSDNDGVADGEEAGFLNIDKNLDGIDDAFDVSRAGAVDNNGDGIDDNIKLPDHNDDGKPDYLDAKYQNQKRILVKETNKETKIEPKNKAKIKIENITKQESVRKTLVTETKEELVKEKVATTKVTEKKTPSPDDMVINRHTDSDNDGLSNELEKRLGTNHLSRDSDGDNVSDAIEIGMDVNSPQDSDRDGIIDALDDDDDNDGVPTKLEDLNKDSTAINDDTDADGVPNYLDANDDGDNLLTKVESKTLDSDGDGILDYLDKSDGVKNQANDSNTIKISSQDDGAKEPEIVVLFDGDAAALSAEEDAKDESLSDDTVQNQVLSSLDEMLKDNDLDATDNEVIGETEDEVSPVRASNSASKATSHWNLF